MNIVLSVCLDRGDARGNDHECQFMPVAIILENNAFDGINIIETKKEPNYGKYVLQY